MLADYFTKPQQGVLFRKMRDMIMGNTDISLPTDKTVGIPVVSTTLESRSVLGNENKNDRSPGVHDDIAPTNDVAASTIRVPASTIRVPANRGSNASWAEVARIK
jgi:hypothetical protein